MTVAAFLPPELSAAPAVGATVRAGLRTAAPVDGKGFAHFIDVAGDPAADPPVQSGPGVAVAAASGKAVAGPAASAQAGDRRVDQREGSAIPTQPPAFDVSLGAGASAVQTSTAATTIPPLAGAGKPAAGSQTSSKPERAYAASGLGAVPTPPGPAVGLVAWVPAALVAGPTASSPDPAAPAPTVPTSAAPASGAPTTAVPSTPTAAPPALQLLPVLGGPVAGLVPAATGPSPTPGLQPATKGDAAPPPPVQAPTAPIDPAADLAGRSSTGILPSASDPPASVPSSPAPLDAGPRGTALDSATAVPTPPSATATAASSLVAAGQPFASPTPSRGSPEAAAVRNGAGGKAAGPVVATAKLQPAAQGSISAPSATAAPTTSVDAAVRVAVEALADQPSANTQGDQGDQGGAEPPTPGAASPQPSTVVAGLIPAPADAPAPAVSTPATVQSLAAALVGRAGDRISRFEVVLNPDGLGRVDVKLSLGAQGKLSAALSFDTAHGLAALQARAPELEGALRQAGFDVAPGGLSFTAGAGFQSGGSAGGWGGREAPAPAFMPAGRTNAFAAAAGLDAPPAYAGRAVGGLDIRI